MKNAKTIIAFLLGLLALTACHKDKEFGSEKPEVGEVVVSPAMNQVDFTWKVVYPGKFQTSVEISDNKDLGNSRTVEGTKDGEVFKASVDQLEASTKYYYRIVVWNKMSRQEGQVKSFTTLTPDPEPDVYTITVVANPVEGGTVTGGGEYVANSACTVKATTNEGYTFVNWTKENTVISTEPSITFIITESATYVAHFQRKSYTIEVSTYPAGSGMVSGSGIFNYGDNCSLIATANMGYVFDHWTKDGLAISGGATIQISVTTNATYVAHFTQQTYTITTQSNPSNGGTVSGGGTYTYGQSCTVVATANSGYNFRQWTENGNQVSANANYTFIVTSNRTLLANFEQPPAGAINGLFTINDDDEQVYFSQGNLQYIGSASTPYWKFADNQWDALGKTTGQDSDNPNVDRDLFGWGTSGYNDSSDPYDVHYQPWATSADEVNATYNKYGYGPSTNMPSPNLTGSSANYDWGVYNRISNGSNTTNTWRILTGGSNGEWKYVFDIRSASTVNGVTNARYAKAKVANMNGVILFPDIYLHPTGVPQPVGINQTDNTGWNGNDYSAAEFLLMQAAGAVFLPAVGDRSGTSVYFVGSYGYYWSASYSDSTHAYGVYFGSGFFRLSLLNSRCTGQSVRLVAPAK